MTAGKLALIADLLARAERSDSQAERELALTRAQKEAARHGIDLAEAAYAQAQRGVPLEPEERSVTIGRPRTPGLKTFTALFLAVCAANDIRCLISRDSARVYAHGMPGDLDVAETLYSSLVVQMDVAFTQWFADGGHEAPRPPGWCPPPQSARRPHLGVVRRSFREGFTWRVGELLAQATADVVAQATAPPVGGRGGRAPGQVTSTAVALREKSRAVEEFHRRQIRSHGARGSWNGRRAGAQQDDGAVMAGWKAGGRADLHRRGGRALPG